MLRYDVEVHYWALKYEIEQAGIDIQGLSYNGHCVCVNLISGDPGPLNAIVAAHDPEGLQSSKENKKIVIRDRTVYFISDGFTVGQNTFPLGGKFPVSYYDTIYSMALDGRIPLPVHMSTQGGQGVDVDTLTDLLAISNAAAIRVMDLKNGETDLVNDIQNAADLAAVIGVSDERS